MKKLLLVLLAMLIACTMAFSLVGCGEEPAPEPAPEAEHTCDFGEEWKSDADKHWKECECGAKSEEAAHSATDDANLDGKCDVCGYEVNPAQSSGSGVEDGGVQDGGVEIPDANL